MAITVTQGSSVAAVVVDDLVVRKLAHRLMQLVDHSAVYLPHERPGNDDHAQVWFRSVEIIPPDPGSALGSAHDQVRITAHVGQFTVDGQGVSGLLTNINTIYGVVSVVRAALTNVTAEDVTGGVTHQLSLDRCSVADAFNTALHEYARVEVVAIGRVHRVG